MRYKNILLAIVFASMGVYLIVKGITGMTNKGTENTNTSPSPSPTALSPQSPAPANPKAVTPAYSLPALANNEQETYTCEVPPPHPHGTTGVLTFEISNKKISRFKCTLSVHHECFAGPDGIWTECTFTPQEWSWPYPVPTEMINEIKSSIK